MKKIVVLIACIVLGSALYADEVLQKSMEKMENGLNDIQKGFLYNQVALIKSGVKEIEDANNIFNNMKETSKYLPEKKKHMSNIAYNAAKRMDAALDDLVMYLDAHQYSKAQYSYSEVINACGSCHAVVRGW